MGRWLKSTCWLWVASSCEIQRMRKIDVGLEVVEFNSVGRQDFFVKFQASESTGKLLFPTPPLPRNKTARSQAISGDGRHDNGGSLRQGYYEWPCGVFCRCCAVIRR